MTNIAAACGATDPFPEAIRANLDAHQAISASMANTLSDCLAKFGTMQLDATKAALAGSLGAARDFFSAANLPVEFALPAQTARHDQTEAQRSALPDQTLQQTKHRLRELGIYQERAKEEERKRIARELHDELGSLLTSVKAHVSVAQAHAVAAGLPEDPALATASALVDEAIETVRRIIIDLRPSVLDQLGIWAALEWYADRISAQHDLICGLHIESKAALTEIDPERSTALYRIVQEAVTNALRHAAARRIEIRAVRCNDDIEVEVSDDGKGMDADRMRESFGIAGMRERALGVGGELVITSTVGKGTCVALHMPLKADHEE